MSILSFARSDHPIARRVCTLLACALICCFYRSALAEVISQGSPSFEVFWDITTSAQQTQQNHNIGTDLTANATFSNFNFSFNGGTSQTTVTMNLVINNTTNGSAGTDAASARLTIIGFNTIPDAIPGGASITNQSPSGVFATAQESTFPNFGTVDLCFTSGSNCSGGGSGGLSPPPGTPNSVSFTLSLTFSGDITSLTLGSDTIGGTETFDAKWQANSASYEFADTSITGGGGQQILVPEPSSLLVVGTGLFVWGWTMRRQRGGRPRPLA